MHYYLKVLDYMQLWRPCKEVRTVEDDTMGEEHKTRCDPRMISVLLLPLLICQYDDDGGGEGQWEDQHAAHLLDVSCLLSSTSKNIRKGSMIHFWLINI